MQRVSMPPIGIASWLVGAGSFADSVRWITGNGFTGISLLQSSTDLEATDRVAAAAAIREAGLNVTYHGNVHHKLTADGALDHGFVDGMLDDILWWHENAGPVRSTCSDAIHRSAAKQAKVFDAGINTELLRKVRERMNPCGVQVGIENAHGGGDSFGSLRVLEQFKDTCGLPGLGMLLDAGHANIRVRAHPEDGVADVGEYVRRIPFDILEVHLSDNMGERDEHKHIGYGNLDLHSLFKALKETGFDGQLTLEICDDILSGRYGLHIRKPEVAAQILKSRDAVLEAWARA